MNSTNHPPGRRTSWSFIRFWLMLITAGTTLAAMAKAAVDAALIARVDQSELASFAFAFPIIYLAISAGRGIYTGTSAVFTGGSNVCGQRVDVKPFFSALVVSFAAGVGFALSLYAVHPALLRMVGAAEYADDLARFVRIWVWSVPAMFLSANAFALARNLGYLNTASILSIGANVTGLPLSYYLILNRGYGIEGAAYSTVAVSLVSTLCCLALVARHLRVFPTNGASHWSGAARTLRIAVPVFFSNILLFMGMLLTTAVFAHMGEAGLAAFGVVGRAEQLILALQIAFTTIAIPEVAAALARKDHTSVLRTVADYRRYMLATALAVAVILVVAAPHLSEVLTGAKGGVVQFYLRYLSFFALFQGAFILSTTVLNLAGLTRHALFLCGLNYCVLTPTLALLGGLWMGPKGALLMMAGAALVSAVGAWKYTELKMNDWRPTLKRDTEGALSE